MLRLGVITLYLLCSIFAQAGSLDKGFKALNAKDYFKAKKSFEKAMYGYPTVGAYGLSLMFYEDKNPFHSLDSALKYVVYADSAMTMADKGEQKIIQKFSITKNLLSKHRFKIATKAYEMLKPEATVEDYQVFLDKYPFANELVMAVNRRDSVAYHHAKNENSHDAYRNFIINYPGSLYRSEADSLYARTFFNSKVTEGDISTYQQYVRDFPASPYIEEAYDQIFLTVVQQDTKEGYDKFIKDYPDNAYTDIAWRNVIGLTLKERYSEKTLAKLLADYPYNPLSHEVEEELKGFFISYFPVHVDDKWGFIRGDGELVIVPEYEDAGQFNEGLAPVTKRGRMGFVDKKGKVVITAEYDDVTPFEGGITIVEKAGKMGALDRRNKMMVPVEYDDVGVLSSDMILVEDKGKVGYFDASGNQVVGFDYENGFDFKNGFAVVKKEGWYGLINKNNEVILPFKYEWIESVDTKRFRVKAGNLFGISDTLGGQVLPMEYQWIGEVKDKVPTVIVKDNKLGYLSADNNIVIPLGYDVVINSAAEYAFNDGFAKVKKGDKFGVIDTKGEVVMPIESDTLGIPTEGFVAFKNRGYWGYRELAGNKRIIEPKYDQVWPYEKGVAKVRKGDRFGLIDPNGFEVLRVEYNDIESNSDIGLLTVTKNGKKGLMDRDKNLILGFKYDEISIENYRYALATRDGQVFYFDLQKNTFIWPKK